MNDVEMREESKLGLVPVVSEFKTPAAPSDIQFTPKKAKEAAIFSQPSSFGFTPQQHSPPQKVILKVEPANIEQPEL